MAIISRNAARYVAWGAAPLLILTLFTPLPLGFGRAYLSNRAQMIQSLTGYRGRLGEAPIVLAMHGDQFVVTSVLGVPSQQQIPESGTYQTMHWILRYVEPSALSRSMIVLAGDQQGRYSVLVEDAELSRHLRSLTVAQLRDLLEHNPHLYMPFGCWHSLFHPDKYRSFVIVEINGELDESSPRRLDAPSRPCSTGGSIWRSPARSLAIKS